MLPEGYGLNGPALPTCPPEVIQIHSYIESDSNPRFHSSNGTNIRRLIMREHCLWLCIAIFHIKVTDRVSDSISWLTLPSYSLPRTTKQCTPNYCSQTVCSSHFHVLPVQMDGLKQLMALNKTNPVRFDTSGRIKIMVLCSDTVYLGRWLQTVRRKMPISWSRREMLRIT